VSRVPTKDAVSETRLSGRWMDPLGQFQLTDISQSKTRTYPFCWTQAFGVGPEVYAPNRGKVGETKE